MSTAVKNEYAVDHTEMPSLPSFKKIKNKFLPNSDNGRFDAIREECEAAKQEIMKKYGKLILEKDEELKKKDGSINRLHEISAFRLQLIQDSTENVRRLEKEKEDLKTSCEKQKNDLRTYCQERMQSLERENKMLSQIRENENEKQNNEIKFLMGEVVKLAMEVKEYKLENDKLKKKVDAPITTSESRMPYLFGSISKDRQVNFK